MRVPQRTWVVAVAWACGVAAIGCGRDQGGQPQPQPQPEPTETTATASAPLNADPQSPSFAIEARWSVVLRDHAEVQRGDVGTRESNAAAMLVPGFEVALLDHASVGTTQSVLGDSVQLGPKAIVGDVQTNALSDLGAKHGVVAPFTPLPELPALRQVQPGSSPLIVNAHSTVDVTAGAWSTLTVKDHAKVRLAAGLYQVGDLVMQEQSRLEATGAVEIRVAGRLDVAAHAFLGAAPGAQLTARDLRIEVAGMNGAHGGLNETPKSARFAEHDEVHALVLAPNGTLVVGAHGLLFGALAAREVDLGEHTKLTWEEGFPSEGCGGGCDDGNPCTVDACAGGSCTHEAAADGMACDDGDACTRVDACQAGACVGGEPVTCTVLDPCHVAGVCDPSTGVCSSPAAADGTACDDGNACTQADACVAGVCVGSNPVVCAASDACHVAGTCDPVTGTCSNPAAPLGTSCSDGNACNGDETCDESGGCVAGVPPVVDDGNPCTSDTCDQAVGAIHTPVAAATPCSDGNVCNGVEMCDGAGACTSGVPLIVDDANPCTLDACDPVAGVTHTPAAAGTACSDGDACNGVETCDGAGQCVTGTAPALDDGNPCTIDRCDPVAGVVHEPAAAGAPCSDGDLCNGAETCDAMGVCRAGVPLPIDDGDPATLDACDPARGVVHTTPSHVDPAAPTSVARSTRFLYEGAGALQADVAPGTIELRRATVLHGRALDATGAPLAGVTITVARHPELGHTVTRADGVFDLAVNGGGDLVVRYAKAGYFDVDRAVGSTWNEYLRVPDVVLLAADAHVTPVDVAGAPDYQVAAGSTITDESGTRTARVVLPPGTGAQLRLPDGTTKPVSELSLRATEYTVEPRGEQAMPAKLPPPIAYTYAVELSADEAVAAGAGVEFTQPVYVHVDNFLRFFVGVHVPSGYYDPAKGAWVASPDGRVVGVVGVTGGLAELDLDGDGAAESAASLAELGIANGERALIAQEYAPGSSFWRVPITHLTAWDFNWNEGPEPGSTPPNGPPPSPGGPPNGGSGGGAGDDSGGDQDGGDFSGPMPSDSSGDPPAPPDDPCVSEGGSSFECQNQTLGETIALTGVPFALHYKSDRVANRKSDDVARIPLGGATMPAGVQRIDVEVSIAGRAYRHSYPAAAGQVAYFTWHGRDPFGRPIQGAQRASVRVGYVYEMRYLAPSDRPGANYDALFGHFSYYGAPVSAEPARREITLWQEAQVVLGHWDARGSGLGGFSVEPHHTYDPVAKTLYLGDGTKRRADNMPPILTNIAGNGDYNGCFGTCGDGSPALQVPIGGPAGLTVGPDGSVYVAYNTHIGRIMPDGVFHIVAGRGGSSLFGEGVPARETDVWGVYGLTVDELGQLYFIESWRCIMRKIDTQGVIHTIAGIAGQCAAPGGDGGPAAAATINPGGTSLKIARSSDGVIYFLDESSRRLRKIGTDHIVQTVAYADGWGADFRNLTVGPDDSLYLVKWSDGANAVYRLDSLGRLQLVAGGGSGPDGGPAIGASLGGNTDIGIAIGGDGTLYIADGWARVRAVDSAGIIRTLAGTGAVGNSGVGGQPTDAMLYSACGPAIGPDGVLYFSQSGNQVISRVTPSLPGTSIGELVVPSASGDELYVFGPDGRHERTVDTLTRATKWSFDYDASGALATLTDADGNVTTITHDPSGAPTSIVGPYGATTRLSVDANGYLASVTDPLGGTYAASYDPGGLMLAFSDSTGAESHMTYDDSGRLVSDEDAAGATKTLARTDANGGWTVAVTDGLGLMSSYGMAKQSIGTTSRSNAFPNGTSSSVTVGANGSRTVTLPDGTKLATTLGPDPRFKLQSPVTTSSVTTTPSGLVQTALSSRTTTLASSTDPLSLLTLTDRSVINGNTWTTLFDATSRLRTTTSPAGRKTYVSLGAKGHLASAQLDGLLTTAFGYDARGRLTSTTQGVRSQAFGYDANGYLAATTDPLAQTTTFARDAAGRVTSEVLPDGNAVQFGYDAVGRLTSITPPGKPAHQFVYSPVGQLQQYLPPPVTGGGTNSTLYAYDANRNLTDVVRPDNGNVHLDYDAAGRASAVTLPTGETIALGYSPTTGKLTSATGPSAGQGLAYGYDGFLLTDTTWSGQVNGTVHRTYDNFFRLATETVNGANPVTYGYDADGLVTSVGAMTLSPSPVNGLLAGTTLGGVTDSYTYDAYGQIATYTAKFGATVLYAYSIDQRDALGRITQKTETIQGVTHVYQYGYSSRGWLTDVSTDGQVTGHYEYDANGNRTVVEQNGVTQHAYFDDQDRLLAQGTLQFTYTANGEVRTKTDTATGEVTTYAYDALGNLVRVELPDGRVIEYVIDAMGRRVGKKVNGVLVKGWLYRGSRSVTAELDGVGSITGRFAYTPRGRLIYALVADVVYRALTDHLGSPRVILDSAGGSVAEAMEYDAHGQTLADTNPGFQPFGFAGGLVDTQVGNVRFGHRDYDPTTGRWTRTDPIRFSGLDTNLYAYALNDPVNLRDPSGLVVRLCRRVADLPGNSWLGLEHNWIKTDSKEIGLGALGAGVPGHGGSDSPYTFTSWNDHSGQSDKSEVICEDIDGVDEECVNDELQLGKEMGPWMPGLNDCQSNALDVLIKCGLMSGAAGAEGGPNDYPQ